MEGERRDTVVTLPEGVTISNRPRRSTVGSLNPRKASFFIGDPEGNKLPVKIIGPDEQEITPDEIVIPPDGGYGYVIVFAAFMSNVIVDGIVFSFSSIKESILKTSEELNPPLDQGTLALVGSLLTGFYLLTGPFVSAIANKFGFRTVAVLGSLISSAAFTIAWYLNPNPKEPNIGYLIVFYGIVGGIGFSCMYVPAVIAVGFYFEKKRALATGIAICGSGIGNFIFPRLNSFLTEVLGWSKTILVLGMIVLICGALGLLYKPLKPQKTRKMSLMTPVESPEGTPLLMRIKRARDIMKKWDSINSFSSSRDSYNEVQKAGGDDTRARSEALYNRARKSSIVSLKGVSSSGDTSSMQKKRLSVPSMTHGSLAGGEGPNISQAAGVLVSVPAKAPTLKAKSFVGLPDLHEIEEEHGSEEAGSRENSMVPEDQRQQQQAPSDSYDNFLNSKENNNENSSLLNGRQGSIVTCRIGNSMLMIDEMTNSKIIRVASKVTLNKPLYRDDIFYSGSLLRIPDYANNPLTSMEWTAAVTSPTEDEAAPPASGKVDEKKKSKICFGSFGVVKKMLDFSLLSSPTFIVFSVSGSLSMLGMFVPFVYLTDQASFKLHSQYIDETSSDEENAAFKNKLTMLISIIGAANTVGRILSGWIADRPWVNALILNNAAVTLMGLSILIVPLLNAYTHFVGFSCVFGISMACFASLRSILVVELLGLAKLTNAFGLLLLFQGLASIVSTPMAGFIAEQGGGKDFSMSFYVAGTFMLISGIMCYPLHKLNNWEQNRKKEAPQLK